MSTQHVHLARLRTRWSAVGAAVAITLGAGGLSMAQAAVDTGDRPVTVSITAERILDTRTNLGLAGRFADATPRDIQVTGSVPVASGGSKTVVPADAIGVLVNVTVVTPTHDGFLSLRPQGAAGEPTTSTVNFTPGSVEPNGATVDLNGGKVQIWVETSSNSGSADVLLDIVGYTIGHTHDDRYYTEDEVDAAVAAAVAPKANSADVYTKPEVDAAVATKADALEVYAGELSMRYPANSGFMIVSDSFPSPLPSGVATPTLEYLASGTSANCPGIGQAATAGILCVYAYNNLNIGFTNLSGGSNGENKRFGFSIDVSPTTAANAGFFLASWAYRVPTP